MEVPRNFETPPVVLLLFKGHQSKTDAILGSPLHKKDTTMSCSGIWGITKPQGMVRGYSFQKERSWSCRFLELPSLPPANPEQGMQTSSRAAVGFLSCFQVRIVAPVFSLPAAPRYLFLCPAVRTAQVHIKSIPGVPEKPVHNCYKMVCAMLFPPNGDCAAFATSRRLGGCRGCRGFRAC